MKIEFIQYLPNNAWGGSELLWAAVAQRMAETRHGVSAEVGSLARGHSEVRALKERGAGVSLRPRWMDRTFPAERLRGWRAWRFSRSGADLLFVNLAMHGLGLELLEAVRGSGRPYVVLIQSVNAAAWLTDGKTDRLRAVYKGAEAVFFVSEGNRQSAERMLADDLERAQVVGNLPGAREIEASPWPDESPEDVLRLAVVGRIEPVAKGHDLVLEVAEQPKWRERSVCFEIFGKGASEETFRRAVRRAGLGDRFNFHGYVDDREDVWRSCHALLLPSRYEGSPLVMAEAMLSARPVVATAISGCAEWIEPGENGFLAESPCQDALDRALEACWERRDRLREMGASARAKALKRIPRDPTEEMIELLEQSI